MRTLLGALAASLMLAVPAQAAHKPDLRAVRVLSAAYAHPSGELTIRLTARASGRRAKRTHIRAYLSVDKRRSKGDLRLAATGRLPALKRGKRGTAVVKVVVPAGTAPGALHVIACADDPARLRERNERNNCRAAKGTVTITPAADRAKTSAALIAADLAAGKLSPEKALTYRVFALVGDARLPGRYAGDATAEEDHGALRELASAWGRLSKPARRALAPALLPPPVRKVARKRGAHASQGPELDNDPCASTMVSAKDWASMPAAGGKVRIHWLKAFPEDGKQVPQLAADVSHAYARFKSIMGREPLSDGKATCWHGPDGALDIYLADVPGASGYTIPAELTRWTSPECTGFPSFIVADSEPGTFSTRFTVSHELFHAFQNAFPYKNNCAYYTGFDEASANWGAHAAFPEDDGEHFFDYMQGDAVSAVDDQGYMGWPFVLWIDKTFGEQTVGSIYRQFATKSRSAGVDAAIGGFRAHLLDFVKHGWNQGAFPTFKVWDRFEKPAMKHWAAIPETHLFLAGQSSRAANVRADVQARGRDYHAYAITDPKVREIAFRNPLAGDADFRAGAILTFADGSVRFDDWSGKDRVAYCRDKPGQDVASLVVLYGNAELGDRGISGNPELALKDECDGFPWHFKVLNATLKTKANGGMTAFGEHECALDGFPIQGQQDFSAATADDDFSLENDVKVGYGGKLVGDVMTRGHAKFAYTVSGCMGDDPVTSCSTAFERFAGGDGMWDIGFSFEAASPAAAEATLTWAVPTPEVGFVDFDDSVCNVRNIWHSLEQEKIQQKLPLEWFAGSAAFVLQFDGDDQWGEDYHGDAATLAYNWTYTMTLQRVDENGNPL